MVDVPERLRVKASQSAERRAWLASLPDLCRRLGSEWDLRLGEPFQNGHVALVVAATRGSAEVVLKVPMPASIDLGTLPASARAGEADALRLWAGHGAVRLLDHDQVSGAILIERCLPGLTLDQLEHHDQDRVAAVLLPRLHRPPPASGGFTGLAERARLVRESLPERFERCGSPFDRWLLEAAVEWLTGLATPTTDEVLLHGDFHQHNVLADGRESWLAIDPLPMVGDPGYDAVQYLLFRKGDLADPEAAWDGQIDQFCERLGFDAGRTKAWLFTRLITDAVAACAEEGATPAELEDRQGDLWSARLVHRLLP
ncbi:aminoglycoside phosphotransferase family protein [Microlunatus sp. GCM10028923]|uniref:aminoglycoside phosphotransferase family protein n=1 Tax=Microlunatus sp. GCM10028923 TaxID=3273400 RepID=UPI00360D184F